MKKLALIAASLTTALVGFSSAAQAECGEVTVGEANWSTAQILAQIDGFVMEHGFGCSVTFTPTSTTQTLALAQGSDGPLVVSEFWNLGVDQDVLAAAIADGEIELTGKPFPEAGEFWYVSPAFAEAYPEIDTVAELVERPDLFPSPTVEGMGAFHGCPIGIGWGCEHNNTALFHMWDMAEKGWNLENPGSFEGMNSIITDAYVSNGYWVGYYWTPTAIAIENELVVLDWGIEHSADNWTNCVMGYRDASELPSGCEETPQSWTPSDIATATTPALRDTGAYDYVLARELPMAVLGALDSYMGANQASAADTAKVFLRDYQDMWTSWVDADVADAVLAAL
ncbi:MAG: ABC transporter substrate-binding protein [Geminicoccus sp.]|nr:ABC transporter substrate-binding protein [Geminicoccus sp.]